MTLGGPPEGALCEAKGRARVSYEQFLLIYSGKASARDIISMALKRKVRGLAQHSQSICMGWSGMPAEVWLGWGYQERAVFVFASAVCSLSHSLDKSTVPKHRIVYYGEAALTVATRQPRQEIGRQSRSRVKHMWRSQGILLPRSPPPPIYLECLLFFRLVRFWRLRQMQLSGFAASMKFGFSFEYSKPTWTAYYSAKAKTSLKEGEDEETVDQSRSQNASPRYFETPGGMSPLSSTISPGRNCRKEKEKVGEELPGLEGRARGDGRGAVAEASVNCVLFSSDRFRTTGESRKLKRQENDRSEHKEDAAAIARGSDAKDRDEDDGAGSDGNSEGGSGLSGDGACEGGGRRAKPWVHMSLASWIPRLNEGECVVGDPFRTPRGTCCYYSRDDEAEPALLCVRGGLDPSSASWLPVTTHTSITRGVFLPRIGVGVRRQRSCTSVGRCCERGYYRHHCVQQHNQLYPGVFLRRYMRLQFDPSHSVGRAVLCALRDFYGLVHSLPQLRQLTLLRAVNGNHTPDGALMSLLMAKPSHATPNSSSSKSDAFYSSWRDSSFSRLLQWDAAKGSNGYVGGDSGKGDWVENCPSLAAVAGGATTGTILFLLLFGGRGWGVGADKLHRRLLQFSL